MGGRRFDNKQQQPFVVCCSPSVAYLLRNGENENTFQNIFFPNTDTMYQSTYIPNGKAQSVFVINYDDFLKTGMV